MSDLRKKETPKLTAANVQTQHQLSFPYHCPARDIINKQFCGNKKMQANHVQRSSKRGSKGKMIKSVKKFIISFVS